MPTPDSSAAPTAPVASRATALLYVLSFIVVIAIHLRGVPRTIWEYDESLFAMAVEKFAPLIHHPPPPGYPVYIATAQVVAAVTGGTPFSTLVTISIASTLLALAWFIAAFRGMIGDRRAAIMGATLLYLSPSLLVSGTLPQSDAGAMALLALTLLAVVRALSTSTTETRPATLLALCAAATIGWRVQFVIFIGPMLLVTLFLLRNWRQRVAAVQWFGLGCAAWFLPLVFAVGPDVFFAWLSQQANYFATHDADISRSGRSAADLVLRFVAHPWGPKWLAAPALALAAVGAASLLGNAWRSRRTGDPFAFRAAMPLMAGAATYLAFELVMMDPADAVRYTLPTLPAVALLAALGIQSLRRASREVVTDWALIAVYAIGAYAYTAPLLRARATSISPPVAAIEHLRRVAPRNAAVLFDLPLRPHAAYMLPEYRRARVDEGMRLYGVRMDIPLYELTDSASDDPEAAVFRWPTTDAYNKLTRRHYGAASVLRVPDRRRFESVSGIFPMERSQEGGWRWVGPRGVIQLPDVGARSAVILLRLPKDYPLPGNVVHVAPEGAAAQSVTLLRGERRSVTVPLTPTRRIVLTADRVFVPAEIPDSLSRDPRKLSVMLVDVEQVSGVAPQPAAPAPVQ